MSSQSASRLGPWVARLAALGGKKAKRPNRRPPFVPTQEQRETVEKLTALLVSQDSNARDWLRCTKPTLLKYFRAEIQHGRERTVSKLKALVLQHAMRGSLRAATWLLDRIGDLPTPKYRDSDQPWPSGSTQIIIKGGLPPTIINGAADAHEPDAAEEA